MSTTEPDQHEPGAAWEYPAPPPPRPAEWTPSQQQHPAGDRRTAPTAPDTLEPADLDFAAPTEEQRPARVRLAGQLFVVAAPDVATIIDIENAQSTSEVLELFFDDQWPAARDEIGPMAPDVLFKLITGLADFFGISERVAAERAAPNRAHRRRRRTH